MGNANCCGLGISLGVPCGVDEKNQCIFNSTYLKPGARVWHHHGGYHLQRKRKDGHQFLCRHRHHSIGCCSLPTSQKQNSEQAIFKEVVHR